MYYKTENFRKLISLIVHQDDANVAIDEHEEMLTQIGVALELIDDIVYKESIRNISVRDAKLASKLNKLEEAMDILNELRIAMVNGGACNA